MKIVSQKWSSPTKSAPALFLDRDGTLIQGKKVFDSPEEIRLLPGVAQSLGCAQRAGYLLIVVTNQPNIENGINTMEEIKIQNERLKGLLVQEGVFLDAAYACPHKYPSTCHCRKPELGMVEAAQSEFEIDMARSWFIGDTGRDMETGKRAGLRTIRVESTSDYTDTHFTTPGDFMVKSMKEAWEVISARMEI